MLSNLVDRRMEAPGKHVLAGPQSRQTDQVHMADLVEFVQTNDRIRIAVCFIDVIIPAAVLLLVLSKLFDIFHLP